MRKPLHFLKSFCGIINNDNHYITTLNMIDVTHLILLSQNKLNAKTILATMYSAGFGRNGKIWNNSYKTKTNKIVFKFHCWKQWVNVVPFRVPKQKKLICIRKIAVSILTYAFQETKYFAGILRGSFQLLPRRRINFFLNFVFNTAITIG